MKTRINNRLSTLRNGRQFQILGIISLILTIILIGLIFIKLTNRVVNETALFDRDEAAHATPVLELYFAVQSGDIAHISQAIRNQSFYPPVHSLTVLPSYLIAGPSLASTRMATVLTFGVLIIVVTVLIFRTTSQILGPVHGVAYIVTAITIYFVSTSPILIQNAVLSMLELIGCLWVILLLLLCLHLDQSTSKHSVRVFSLSLVLIVITLTKYSFGAIAIPATIAAILSGSKLQTWKKPQVVEAVVIVVVLAIGLGIWFILVGLRGALSFAFDQPQYAPLLSIENLFYYPRSWFTDFHLHLVFGFSTAILAFWGAIKEWNRFPVRTASWVVLFSLLILTISLNNQQRHLTFAAPCIWFLASLGLVHMFNTLLKYVRLRIVQPILLIVFFAFLGLTVFQRAEELQPMLTYAFESRDSDRIEAMQSYVLDNVDFDGRILFLGLFDQFNEVAIRWQVAIEKDRSPSEIFIDTKPQLGFKPNELSVDIVDGETFEEVVLKTVAIQGYYRQIVVVQGMNSTDPLITAAPNALRDFVSTTREFDDLRIDIFDLEGQ